MYTYNNFLLPSYFPYSPSLSFCSSLISSLVFLALSTLPLSPPLPPPPPPSLSLSLSLFLSLLQVPFQDDGKGYVTHRFGGPGGSPYYMMSLPNGVSGGGSGGDPPMMPGPALPSAAWGSSGDVGMPEGMASMGVYHSNCWSNSFLILPCVTCACVWF